MKRGDKYKLRPKEELYFPLQDLDLTFTEKEVEDTQELWKAGIHIADMARQLKRETEEVFILLLDLAMKRKIRERENGVFGIDYEKVDRCDKRGWYMESTPGISSSTTS